MNKILSTSENTDDVHFNGKQIINIAAGAILAILTGSFLYLSRENTGFLILFLLGFFFTTLFTLHHQSYISLALISALSAWTLTLRIPYLPWGDAWQDYAMIIRTLSIGYPDFWLPHETSLQALIAQPLMPAFLAFITSISGTDPMLVQKALVPLIGATAPIILFRFAKESLKKEAAYTGAILFLISTPFLHWLVQPVRETLAIPILFIGLWSAYTYIHTTKVSWLFIALGSIVILPALHTLSPLLFLVSWYGLSVSLILLPDKLVKKRKNAVYCWVIFTIAYLSLALWILFFNTPYMKVSVQETTSLIPIINNSPINQILFFLTLFSGLYVFTYILTTNEALHDLCQKIINQYSNKIILILQATGCISLLVGIIFISGFSTLKTSYPLPMLFSSVIIMILALYGLPAFFSRTIFHIFCWAMTLGAFFLVGIIRPELVIDPLRILSYLFAPLCLIAGYGYSMLITRSQAMKKNPGVGYSFFTIFCMLSLIFTFPAPVLLGFTPQPGDILYEDRQYTVSHPDEEIEGIRWLSENHNCGTIYTDTNIYYASLWLTQDGTLFAKKAPDRLKSTQFNPEENSYVLISDRMFKSAKFGEWLINKTEPLTNEEYQQVVANTTRIYKKEGFEIFLKPAQIR